MLVTLRSKRQGVRGIDPAVCIVGNITTLKAIAEVPSARSGIEKMTREPKTVYQTVCGWFHLFFLTMAAKSQTLALEISSERSHATFL